MRVFLFASKQHIPILLYGVIVWLCSFPAVCRLFAAGMPEELIFRYNEFVGDNSDNLNQKNEAIESAEFKIRCRKYYVISIEDWKRIRADITQEELEGLREIYSHGISVNQSRLNPLAQYVSEGTQIEDYEVSISFHQNKYQITPDPLSLEGGGSETAIIYHDGTYTYEYSPIINKGLRIYSAIDSQNRRSSLALKYQPFQFWLGALALRDWSDFKLVKVEKKIPSELILDFTRQDKLRYVARIDVDTFNLIEWKILRNNKSKQVYSFIYNNVSSDDFPVAIEVASFEPKGSLFFYEFYDLFEVSLGEVDVDEKYYPHNLPYTRVFDYRFKPAKHYPLRGELLD